jgi:NADPH2:quinone reductase
MRAVVMTAAGGPDVLEVRDLPAPAITRGTEMRVRLAAAGVNPVDTKLRSRGTLFPERTPTVLGCDGAGVVESVGPEVDRFAPGDAVYFCNGGIGGPTGNYAEYAVIDQRFAARKPERLSFAAAAAAALVLITAWESLHDRGRLARGQRVLVHAGAGGVGHVAVQLARLAGARVAATVGSAEKAELVQRLGAEHPILYRQADFAGEVLDWSDGAGVDLALDTVGGKTFADTFPAVKVYGDLVTLLQPPADVDWKVARNRNLRISLELMLTPMAEGLVEAQAHQAGILAQCATLIDEGELDIHLDRSFPLEQAAEAHRLIEAGGMTGKLALTLDG